MRFIEIKPSRQGGQLVRQLWSAVDPDGPIAAAVIGDEAVPHSVRWLRLADGAETQRRDLPATGGEAGPLLWGDLSVLAFVRRHLDTDVIVLEKQGAALPPQRELECDDRYNALAISPDGQVVMACTDGCIAGWRIGNAFSGEPSEAPIPLAMRISEGGACGPMAIAPCGMSVQGHGGGCSVLQAGCSDWAGVIDLPKGSAVRALLFDPTGGLLCIAAGKDVTLWRNTAGPEEAEEMADYEVVRRLEHDSPVAACAFSPDGSALATGAEDGVVRVWDVATGKMRSAFDWQIGPIRAIVFSADGFVCLAGGDGKIALWDLDGDEAPPSSPPPTARKGKSSTTRPTTRARKRRDEAAPAPADEGPPTFGWRRVAGITEGLPAGALVVGQEADGAPLYAARAPYLGATLPGKVRPGFAGANVAAAGREVTVNPFEVLVGTVSWVKARGGQVPPGAVPCGQESNGAPLYLARAQLHGGTHPGKLAAGGGGAVIPYGGQEVEVRTYEVLVGHPEQGHGREGIGPAPLLRWDFENTMSDRGASISAGMPSDPRLISGFVSQTGGGPAEVWGADPGTVFLTRQLGTNEMFLWLTVTAPVFLASVTFRHWHNHNLGYPTHPGYEVQLQLDSGEGPQNVGPPLALNNESSGRTDTIAIGRALQPGSHRLRWLPRRLAFGRDTGSEFFAVKGLLLDGPPVDPGSTAR